MHSLIYVHAGNPFYLALSVKQASTVCHGGDVILLGDRSNRHILGVKHFEIANYFERAKRFDRIYVNHSPNDRAYELFCFQRWMVIWEFMQQHPEYDDAFVYCDSDTLLYADVFVDLKSMNGGLLAQQGKGGPAFTFFNKHVLGQFCDTIEWLYQSDDGLKYIEAYMQKVQERHLTHGFSDMSAFECFINKCCADQFIDTMIPNHDGETDIQYSCYDQNINLSHSYEMSKNGFKKFIFKNGRPFAFHHNLGEFVFFKGIHFQGKAKYEMLKYTHSPMPFMSRYWRQYYLIYTLKKIKRQLLKLWKR